MTQINCPTCKKPAQVVDYEPNINKPIGYSSNWKKDHKAKSRYYCNTVGCTQGTFEGGHIDTLSKKTGIKQPAVSVFDFTIWEYKVQNSGKNYAHLKIYAEGHYTYFATAFGEAAEPFVQGTVTGEWVADIKWDKLSKSLKFAFNEMGGVMYE